jgi:hypothetical protein
LSSEPVQAVGPPSSPELIVRGKQPKLSAKQQTELRRMHATGDYSIADLAELFSIGRATCTGLSNGKPPEKADSPDLLVCG